MKARMAQALLRAYCQKLWPDDANGMESTVSDMLVRLTGCDTDTHKYFPADELTEKLGLVQGSGVWSRLYFDDGSSLLLTCDGKTATWDGKSDPQWGKE